MPYVLETPIKLELTLKHYRPVELLGYLPGIERINAHTIKYTGKDMVEISRFLTFVLEYQVDLQP
jgi:D-amino peptidase